MESDCESSSFSSCQAVTRSYFFTFLEWTPSAFWFTWGNDSFILRVRTQLGRPAGRPVCPCSMYIICLRVAIRDFFHLIRIWTNQTGRASVEKCIDTDVLAIFAQVEECKFHYRSSSTESQRWTKVKKWVDCVHHTRISMPWWKQDD